MNEFWNNKYNINGYFYGTRANEFFKEQLLKTTPGKILMPAEGEGRNAVFAALKGWDVVAFDPSSVARQKALDLAKKSGVTIKYMTQQYGEVNFANNSFDAIGLTFTHLPPELRKTMHKNYHLWLKPGGTLIMEAFSKEQLNFNSGGPDNLDMLFSEDELRGDFSKFSRLDISVTTTELSEGPGHQGMASTIRVVGIK